MVHLRTPYSWPFVVVQYVCCLEKVYWCFWCPSWISLLTNPCSICSQERECKFTCKNRLLGINTIIRFDVIWTSAHSLLCITPKHTFNSLEKRCFLRNQDELLNWYAWNEQLPSNRVPSWRQAIVNLRNNKDLLSKNHITLTIRIW